MDASSGQQHQDQMGTNSLENMLVCSKSQQQERKPRPQPEQALKCPRCDSTNTKFCYYNNYSLSQPRYFCKSCRRYWTKGGTLRNVPVGGGCRKNKRSSSSSTTTSSTSSASSKRIQDHIHQPLFTTDHIPNIINPLTGLPHLGYDTNDLSLAFDRLQKQNGGQMGGFDHDHDHQHHLHHHDFPILGGLNPSSNSPSPAFLDALRSGFLENHNNINNNFQNLYYGYGGGNLGEIHENVNGSGGVNGGEMLQMTNYEDHHHHHHHQHHNMSNSNTSNSSNATTTAVTVTTMKQEFCNNNNISSSRENDNKILWGFPWQLNNGGGGGGGGGGGDHHGNLVGGDLDSTGRESWNGFNSSNWHGLLNSPLM